MDRQQEFVLRTLEERDIRFVRLWFTDILGYLKSVAIAPAELEGAFAEGIATVYQDLAVVGLMEVWRNFFLGSELRKGNYPLAPLDISGMRRIADEGISAAELARVKTQAIATQVYKRDSLMGQAMEIGYLESAGLSWRDEQRLLEGLRAVTAEEVQAVAKRHFDDTSLNTARLDPQPLAEKRPRSPFAAPRH